MNNRRSNKGTFFSVENNPTIGYKASSFDCFLAVKKATVVMENKYEE
jgi:hypothetical protein